MPLYEIKSKKNCIIQSLPEVGLLHYLGLRKGLKVSVMSKQPFGGPVVIQMGNNRSIAISKEIAQKISVAEVS